VVGAGGVAVIASILGILLFLVVEVLPLFRATRVELGQSVPLSGAPPEALLVDEHRTHAAVLGLDGVVRVWRIADGALVVERPLLPEAGRLDAVRANATDSRLLAATEDGQLLLVPVVFAVGFRGDDRFITPEIGDPVVSSLNPAGSPLRAFTARAAETISTVAAQLADGRLVLEQRTLEENFLTGERHESVEHLELASPVPARELLLDEEQRNLYAVAEDGRLLWWRLPGADSQEPVLLSYGPVPVTTAALLIGERSLVAGRADGTLDVWSQVLGEDGTIAADHIRSFPSQGAPIRRITASQRNRSFLVQDAEGGLGLYHATSRRTLWRGESPVAPASLAAYAPKGDAVLLADEELLVELAVHNPHPESALSTFFGKIRYEGYEEAAWVWQSTGGTGDFESKLSLTPLLFGTLKATVYSLILAVPLAVLAAIYTAQFMHPRLQRVVKPTIEIMASLPSVVLGFLAGLWLAPRLEGAFPALLMILFAAPVVSILAGAWWRRIPRRLRGRLPDGAEIGWYAVILLVALAVCLQLNGQVEAWLFGGDFPAWLRESTGLPYEQRNAIVGGIAMGFAVIPIIFAISEDALSSVPKDLVAGSLALGADRWQTVVRVVLPTASPGIFSATMVGFGRAIGETMIVLMATGNTPIMDWNLFNGFRTLSANIAVEIPEAPVGSTLYRTLFVAAILLFAVTFVINTIAELVRQRLRTRYARL
jgi:phosphate transport system permease protein